MLLMVLGSGQRQVVFAQSSLSDTTIMAEVTPQTVTVGEPVLLTITVVGSLASLSDPALPNLAGFELFVSGSSQRKTVINGHISFEQQFTYQLRPTQTGTLTIPAIEIVTDLERLQTEPLTVEVVPYDSQPLANTSPQNQFDFDAPYHVEAEVDLLTPYLGQQVVYTFRLYQTSMFMGEARYEDPPFTDFWNQTVIDRPSYRKIINGKTYLVSEIKTAIFPATLGQITIGPARLFVPGGLMPAKTYETRPLTVDAQPLPSEPPDSFQGAVGQYTIQAMINESMGRVNEPLAFSIDVAGFGNLKALKEPTLPPFPNWRIFNSTVSTDFDARQDSLYGVRHFEWLILPTQSGEYVLPPIEFSYFDPRAEQYETVSTEPIQMTILPDEAEFADEFNQTDSFEPTIRPIKSVPMSLKQVSPSLLTHPLYWGCWVAPALMVGGLWLIKKRRRQAVINADSHRRQQAYRKAISAIQAINADDYAAMQRLLLEYLAEKLDRPTSGLTKAQLRALLTAASLPAALIDRTETCLAQINASRFAPQNLVASQSIIHEVQELIDHLEQAFV